MKKVFYAQVGGLYYPLVFSLGAKRRMVEINKALKPIQKAIGNKNIKTLSDDEKLEVFGEAMEGVGLIGEILIQQVNFPPQFRRSGILNIQLHPPHYQTMHLPSMDVCFHHLPDRNEKQWQ